MLHVDEELEQCLTQFPHLNASVVPDRIASLRDRARQFGASDELLKCQGAIEIEHLSCPLGNGVQLPLLMLRPTKVLGPFRAICFVHGGGMIAGDERTGLEAATAWVQEFGIAVYSIGYRLAPEYPHPTPVEDVYAALYWIDQQRQELGLTTDPLVLIGVSAGGGLAAGAALLARDRDGPRLGELMLLSPMLDDRPRWPSSLAFDADVPWDRTSNATGWASLLGPHAGGSDIPAYAAPARAGDLAGMPPSYLEVGSAETFRDECIDFAQRLTIAGIPTEFHLWSGAFHGFDRICPDSALARTAQATRIDYLRRRLGLRAAP